MRRIRNDTGLVDQSIKYGVCLPFHNICLSTAIKGAIVRGLQPLIAGLWVCVVNRKARDGILVENGKGMGQRIFGFWAVSG